MHKQIENKQWYNKKEILEIYPIGETTYKRRIKNLSNPEYSGYTRMSIKKLEKSNLKSIFIREIHVDILDNLFAKTRVPSPKNIPKLEKWVNQYKWDWIGNIVPGHSYICELKSKMHLFFDELKKQLSNSNQLVLFYSIENTIKDGYYHCHFLIKTPKNDDTKDTINQILRLICEENTRSSTPIWLKPYDRKKFGNRGSNYSLKDLQNGYDILR